MAETRKVIITCAVTGSIHTPTMTPYLPITPDEIAAGAVGAAGAVSTWRARSVRDNARVDPWIEQHASAIGARAERELEALLGGARTQQCGDLRNRGGQGEGDGFGLEFSAFDF